MAAVDSGTSLAPTSTQSGIYQPGTCGSVTKDGADTLPAQRRPPHSWCHVELHDQQAAIATSPAMLHAIYQAPSRAKAEQAFDLFLKSFTAKYPKATECLAKDRACLLTYTISQPSTGSSAART